MNEIMEMKANMVSQLATLLIQKHRANNIEEALDEVLNSATYAKLMNDDTHLYYQSPLYVFSFLENELSNGKMG